MMVGGAGCEGGRSAAEHIEKASDFSATGDFRSAVVELKNALQAEPENVDARWQLGQIYVRVREGASAVKELERARDLGLRSPELSIALIEARILNREFDKALSSLAIFKGSQGDTAALILSGEAQLGIKDYEGAQRAFQAALKAGPGNLKAQRGLARVALAQRDFNEAERQLALALQSPSEELEAWALMGQLELMRGDFEAALKAYQFADSVSAMSPAIRIGIVRALLGLGRATDADEHLTVLHTASPNHPLINYYRAVSARIHGHTEEAEEALREVLRVHPGHIQTLLLMGTIKLGQGELRQAEEALAKFVGAAPKHLPGRKMLASVYLELGQPSDAVTTLEPALEMAGDDAQLLGMLGSAYLRNQVYQKGTELLERAVELDPTAVNIRTQLAYSHLVTGSPDKAVAELKDALGTKPGFKRANLLLIFAHLQNKKWDDAAAAAADLAARQPDDPVPLNLLGSALAGKGDEAGAKSQFERALALKADFYSASLNLAALEERAGDHTAAAERYAKILEEMPGQEQAAMALARLVEQRGDQDETDRLLQLARTNNKQSLGPRVILGNRYLRQGRLEEAQRVTDEAERIAPNNPDVRLAMARLHAARGQSVGARAIFEELVKVAPDNTTLRFELARVELRARNFSVGKHVLENLLVQDPSHLRARMALGELAIRDGDFEQAKQIAAKVTELHPGEASGLSLLGDTLLMSSDIAGATVAFSRALEVKGNSSVVLKLFTAYRRAGDSAGGRKVLETWLEAHPDDGPVRLALATSDHGTGEKDTARSAYEGILENAPNNFVALNNLAWLYFERGDERAVEFAKRAYELAGKRSDVADTYGWILVQLNKVEQGLAILDRAARGAPDQMEIRYHHAVALHKAGESAQALKLLESVLASDHSFADKQKARTLYIELK
jgi:putative PEP-CTERM system TPR-repeat lipoprotein